MSDLFSISVLGMFVGVVAGFGWVMNIVKLAAMPPQPFSGLMVARAAGVFVGPLGAVLGFV